jgi:sugar/nucleoside kinase (ribokinase family)
MKKYNIIMIGHVSKDIMIYKGGDEKEERFTGGPVIYSSASASATGAEVLVVTKAASEDRKDIEYIEDSRTDVKIIDSHESTSIENIYLTEDRERRKVTLISQADPFTISDVPENETDIYHLAGLFRGEIPDELITYLAEKGKVAIDAQGLLRCSEEGKLLFRDWDKKAELMSKITFLKTDAAEAEILTGTDDRAKGAEMLAEWGAKEVMVTHNTEVIILVDGKIYSAPFNPSNLSGRTGRGDTCFAAYLAKRLTAGPQEAVSYAAALTSIKMENPGRFSGSVKDVEERIKTLK